jgi:hypothetical protein
MDVSSARTSVSVKSTLLVDAVAAWAAATEGFAVARSP